MTIHPLCLNDITIFPPPCLNAQRAAEIYRPAFTNIIEYVHNSRIEGDILEFGTFNGYTARTLAELMHQYRSTKHLHLYDSWEGFPAMEGVDSTCPEVTQHDTWHQGDCRPMMERAPEIIKAVLSLILPEHVHTHKGFYKPDMELPQKAAVVHVDCDLYESTKIVLNAVVPALQQGSVIMFDDWNNNFASYVYGERKAFLDIFPKTGLVHSTEDGKIGLEKWFAYGSSGMAFIVHKG